MKIANLRRSLVIYIDESKERQPFLISISEQIEEIIDQLRERQRSVESALGDLAKLTEVMTKRIYKGIEKHQEWLYNEKIERGLRMGLYKLLQPRKVGAIEEVLAHLYF